MANHAPGSRGLVSAVRPRRIEPPKLNGDTRGMFALRARRLVGAALTLIALAVGGPSAGAAQAPDPADQEARALFDAGSVAYGQGRFERALEHFQRAYELSPRPRMLFNLGNTHDRLGQSTRALQHLRRYLREVPDAENREFVRRRIEILERSGGERPPDRPTSSSGDPTLGIVFLAVGGVVLLGAVGTGAWWVDRDGAIEQCNLVACANGAALTEERDAASGVTFALGGLGLIGIATGVGLLVAAADDGNNASVRCSPTLGGLHCAGRF